MILDASYTLLVACIVLTHRNVCRKIYPCSYKNTYQKPSLVAFYCCNCSVNY